jgi:hypothetical protein
MQPLHLRLHQVHLLPQHLWSTHITLASTPFDTSNHC